MTRAALVLGVLLWATSTFAAPPTVTIRARTAVRVESVSRGEDGISVSGRLVDAISGAGIPDGKVEISFGGRQSSVTTNGDGTFEAVFDLPGDETYALEARFTGDTYFAESRYGPKSFDIGKEPLFLTLRLPSDLDPDQAALAGEVSAASERSMQSVEVEITADNPSGGAPVRLAQVTTNEEGTAAFEIPRAKLGHAGDRRLHAVFEGNDVFNPAEAEAHVRIVTATRFVDLSTPRGAVRYEGKVRIAGRLVEQDGAPVSGATVNLSAGGQRVTAALTDGKGGFVLRVPASELGVGDATFTVEYVSSTSWRRGALSNPITVSVAPPRPVPVGYTFLAFALTAGAFLAYLLVRTRPWVAWTERWRRRRRRRSGSAPEAAIAGDAPPATGLKPAHAGFMSTLRRPADLGFSGRVRDVLTGAALAGARVELTPEREGAELVLETDEQGGFVAEKLAVGTWRARARARGYVTEHFHVTIPHRGELRGVRIDLLPVRERVFAIYRDVAVSLLPKPELWGVWTPREIFDHVRRRRPAGALGALTDFIEEAYFSARTPDEAIVPSAQASADAARQELTAER